MSGDRLTCTCATFRRETCLDGAYIPTVSVGARGQFRVEIRNAFQLPTILSALRLSTEDERRVIEAINTHTTITVEGWTSVSDLLCVGFAVKAGEMARLQAA